MDGNVMEFCQSEKMGSPLKVHHRVQMSLFQAQILATHLFSPFDRHSGIVGLMCIFTRTKLFQTRAS